MSLYYINFANIKSKFATYKDLLAPLNETKSAISAFPAYPDPPLYIATQAEYDQAMSAIQNWQDQYDSLQLHLAQIQNQLSIAEKNLISEMPVNQWVQLPGNYFIGISDTRIHLQILTTAPAKYFPEA